MNHALYQEKYISLVTCELETGRTHQIRAHAQSINHPLFSDAAYGGDKIRYVSQKAQFKTFVENLFKVCNRQALHAFSLEIEHPVSKERIKFEKDFPEDMKTLLEKLRNFTN
mgnify:CR=1 FL=1